MRKNKPDDSLSPPDFFRFPSTPHLGWLAEAGPPRDDKMQSPEERQTLLRDEVVVEEKLDGANLGFSLDPTDRIRIQNRGGFLIEPYSGQFARLPAWLGQHQDGLKQVLRPELIVFGEWCAARHSLQYDVLPDWFLVFDVYDQAHKKFWSTARRNALAATAGLATVPEIANGHLSLESLNGIVMRSSSHFAPRQGLEGVVIRQESSEWCISRAKLVNPNFIQTIETHWRQRAIEWNRISYW